MGANKSIDIKALRKANGLSQGKLAAFLGIGQSFVSQMEKGKPVPEKVLDKIMSNPDWTIPDEAILRGGTVTSDEHPYGDHIEQNGGHNNIGKIQGDTCPEVLALRREIEMLRAQLEELKAEKAAYWEMIKELTKR